MIRILVVDDRIDFRLAFVGLLEGQPDLEVASQAGSLAEARAMLEGIDVALVDRGLPDGDGLGLMGDLREVNPGARFFVISSTVEMRHPEDAIEAGAEGIIDKLDPPSGCSKRYGEREVNRVPTRLFTGVRGRVIPRSPDAGSCIAPVRSAWIAPLPITGGRTVEPTSCGAA